MISVCLPSDTLFQHLPPYLGFSYLGRGVSLHGCYSKVQLLLLTLDEGYVLTATTVPIATKAFDCVDHNKLWKILKEMGIPDHLTCLLRNQLELDMEQ